MGEFDQNQINLNNTQANNQEIHNRIGATDEDAEQNEFLGNNGIRTEWTEELKRKLVELDDDEWSKGRGFVSRTERWS